MSPSRRPPRNRTQSPALAEMLRSGLELHQAGHGRQAAEIYRQILRRDDKHPAANHLFGLTQLQQGEPTLAIRHIAVALQAEPSNAQYLGNMGAALNSAGRSDEAVEVLLRAVSINPESAEAYANLGLANRALGRFDAAADAYRRAAEIRPAEPAFHYRSAEALRQAGNHLAAELPYRRAIELRPDYSEAYANLGFILIDQGRSGEALQLLDGGLATLPNDATLHLLRGRALYARGDLQSAVSGFDRAISLRPNYGEAYLQRANSVRHRQRDTVVAAIEGVLRSESATSHDRIFAGFALGKALADIGDHFGSIAAFIEANRMQRQRLSFSLQRETDFMRSTVERFREVDEGAQSAVSPEADPIFIVGLPRSGKSTLERLLASHPVLAAAGELPTMGRLVRELIRDANGAPLRAIAAERFAALGQAYIEEASKLVPNGRRVIDTMPFNYYHLGVIRLALPRARIIHCVRSRADHRVAIFEKLLTGAGFEYSNDLEELQGYHAAYLQLMAAWHSRFPGLIHDLDVGALMSDRRDLAQIVLSLCGLAWDDALLAPVQSEPQLGDWSSDQHAANHSAHMAAWRQLHPELWT